METRSTEPTPDDDPHIDPRTRRRLLFACLSASFLTPFVASASTVALPDIGRDLDLSATALGWITTSYLLAATVTMLPAGRLGDILGRRLMFIGGLGVFTVASIGAGLAPSGPLLITSRVIQGLGAGMYAAGTVALLTSAYPSSERGRVLGLNVATVFTGLSVGPLTGGVLTGAFGWRGTFLVIPLISLPTVAMGIMGLHGPDDRNPGRFDLGGALAYAAILSAVMYGLSSISSVTSVVILLIGLIAVVPLLRYERKIQDPLFHPDLFRNQMFSRSTLAALAFFTSTISVPFVLSLYLQFVEDFSPEATGLVLLSQPVIQAVFSPLMGRLSDRFQPRLLASTGMGLTAIGIGALVAIGTGPAMAIILPTLALLGFARALFSSPNANAVMSSVDRRFYGAAAGTLGTVRNGGQMLGVGLVTAVVGAAVGGSRIAPGVFDEFLASARISFVILAAVSLVGTFVSLARGSIVRTEVSPSHS